MATSTTPNQVRVVEAPEPAKQDFRRDVTDQIISMLEAGVAPWQKPWDPACASREMPMNPTTGKAYRGGNAIHLMAMGLQRAFTDPRWTTYRQAASVGWQVRRGEKGTQIEFWELKTTSDTRSEPISAGGGGENQSADEPEPARANRLIHRVYTVFNAQQIEGVPAWSPKERSIFEAVEAGERILRNSGAAILHDQSDRSFYNRLADTIHLPPKYAFKDAAGYYGTALHELAHWSGHPSRLNRATLNESYQFGDISYAKEELRAELASVFLAAERGIPHNPEQHAAYVSSWISVLKQDKNEIFRAAHDASRVADFLVALERDRSIPADLVFQPVSQSTELGRTPNAAQNWQRERPDREYAASKSSSTPARNRATLARGRTTGRGR